MALGGGERETQRIIEEKFFKDYIYTYQFNIFQVF